MKNKGLWTQLNYRQIRHTYNISTGAGGMRLMTIAFEEYIGFKRVYLKKVSQFLVL